MKNEEWETPQWLFNQINDVFNFDMDVAASDINHKCDNYLTKETCPLNSALVVFTNKDWDITKLKTLGHIVTKECLF